MLKKILVVDDEPHALQVIRHIMRDNYRLMFARSAAKAMEAAIRHQPDLILMDIVMLERSGYEACEKLRDSPLTRHIPVILITSMSEGEYEAHGFDCGAVDYVRKPISAPILLRRVQTHLSLIRLRELEDVQREATLMLGEAGHYNDTDTGLHIWRMAAYARALAKAAGWESDLVERMEMAAPMHDTGKIGVRDTILTAPRKLTPDEWVAMQRHTAIGFGILSKSERPVFRMAAEIARYHHEKWDGSGYPDHLARDSIPKSARIVAVADVFDALTMKRPYKEPWTVEASMEEIRNGAGSHFEPELVTLFGNILPEIVRIKKEWSARE